MRCRACHAAIYLLKCTGSENAHRKKVERSKNAFAMPIVHPLTYCSTLVFSGLAPL